MRCAQVDPHVERFMDGVLDTALTRRIETHVRSCARCTARLDTARAVLGGLAASLDRAPPGFATRVMDAVYREALAGRPRSVGSETAGAPPSRMPARVYRRLGLSFLLTAGVLAASLFVPRAAYPSLLGTGSTAGFSRDGSAAVRDALNWADSAVRGILREQANGGSVR
jgi:hypothetical protein